MSRFLLLLLLLSSAALPVLANEEPPRIRVVWIDDPPEIDGALDDAVWQRPPLIDELIQVQPVQGGRPSQKTEIWIATDGVQLFVAVRCHDTNPELIVANRMLRDDFLFADDRITFALDTFHDRRNGYVFEINPNGARHDVLVEGSSFVSSWDAIWEARTSIDAGGWSLEVAIPFQSLNFDPHGDAWGFNIGRGIRRNNEDLRWTDPYPQRFVSDLGRAGVLEGLRGAQQGLGLEIVPALTVRRIEDNEEDIHETNADASGDFFYKLLPSLTASVTANTSFAETEVDERRVNLSRFNLFFPEKRQFFLQDALIFDFGEFSDSRNRATTRNGMPFFSRRIGVTQPDPDVDEFEAVDILVGGKITGRIDRVKIGALHTLVDGHGDAGKQNLTVGRVAVNLMGESSIGAIVTNGDPDGLVDNTLVGTDFVYRNTDFRNGNALSGTAWFQHSFTQGVDSKQMAYGATLEYPNDIVNWKVGFRNIDENFVPKLGFVNRVAIRQYDAEYRYRIRRTGWLRTLDTRVSGFLVTDPSNETESYLVAFTPLAIATEVDDRIQFVFRHFFERPVDDFDIPGLIIAAGSYHFDTGTLRLQTSRNRPVRGVLDIGGGTFYDGYSTRLAPGIEWRPSRHWLVQLEYELNDIRLPQGDSQTHLARLRVNTQFTPDLSWISLVQYDNISDSVGINSRIRWIIQDGREFFFVFNQGLDVSDGIRSTRSEPLVKGLWTLRF